MYILEWTIQWFVTALSVLLLVVLLRKPGTKDWLLVYMGKAFVSSFVGFLIVERGLLEFPVRFLPQYFESSILFDYLAFPVLCVAYNQTSRRLKLNGIILQAVLYSGGITVVEFGLERYTAVIEYHGWTWYYTFATLTLTMLSVRAMIALILKLEKPFPPDNES